MDRQARVKAITQLCEQAGCNEKVRAIHFKQFVDHQWHPHPSKEFLDWWRHHKNNVDDGIDAKRAYNCQNYRDEFMEAKQYGSA